MTAVRLAEGSPAFGTYLLLAAGLASGFWLLAGITKMKDLLLLAFHFNFNSPSETIHVAIFFTSSFGKCGMGAIGG